jgi:hypothetical protein
VAYPGRYQQVSQVPRTREPYQGTFFQVRQPSQDGMVPTFRVFVLRHKAGLFSFSIEKSVLDHFLSEQTEHLLVFARAAV